MITPPLMLAAAVGLVLGALIGFVIARNRERARQELEKSRAQDEASRILERARSEAENARKAGELAGREEGFRLREAWGKRRVAAGKRSNGPSAGPKSARTRWTASSTG